MGVIPVCTEMVIRISISIWCFECWRVEIESARAEEKRKKEFNREVRF